MTPAHFALVFGLGAAAPADPAAPAPASGEADAMTQARNLYRRGAIRYESADYAGAIELFTEALDIVASEGGDDTIRLRLLYNIGRAHEEAYRIDQKVEHLRQAKVLYERYLASAERVEDAEATGEVRERLLVVNGQLEGDEPTREPIPHEDPAPATPPPTQEAADRGPGWGAGVGLVVVGASALIGGAVLAALGGTRERAAQGAVDDFLEQNGDLTPAQVMEVQRQGDDFVASERRRGVVMMGVGGGLAGLGAIGVGVGAYLVVRARRHPARVGLSPRLAPGFAGLHLSARF